MNTPLIVAGTVVAAERRELGVDRATLATLIGTHAAVVRAYEEGTLEPSAALQREVQFALHFLQMLQYLDFPGDLNNPAELLPNWVRFNAERLPAERGEWQAERAQGIS